MLVIPQSQLANPNAILQTEATLEDWTICYPKVVKIFETPKHNGNLKFVPPNTKIGGLCICKGDVGQRQLVFYAAQSLNGSSVRWQVTLFGSNVVVTHTPFGKNSIVKNCILDSGMPDLPQICKDLEENGVSYVIQEYK